MNDETSSRANNKHVLGDGSSEEGDRDECSSSSTTDEEMTLAVQESLLIASSSSNQARTTTARRTHPEPCDEFHGSGPAQVAPMMMKIRTDEENDNSNNHACRDNNHLQEEEEATMLDADGENCDVSATEPLHPDIDDDDLDKKPAAAAQITARRRDLDDVGTDLMDVQQLSHDETVGGAEAAAASLEDENQSTAATAQQPPPVRAPQPAAASVSIRKPPRARSLVRQGQKTGRWTDAEHESFLRGLRVFGREWKRVAEQIPTRTSAQVRSHAQKYFFKLHRGQSQDDARQQHESGDLMNLDGSMLLAPLDSVSLSSSSSTLVPGSPAWNALPASVQAEAARILAHPETIQQEVQETLQRLQERYAVLQRRLQQQRQEDSRNNRQQQHPIAQQHVMDDLSSSTSMGSVDESAASSSLQEQELVALQVLQGGLPGAPPVPLAATHPVPADAPSSFSLLQLGKKRSRRHSQRDDSDESETAGSPPPDGNEHFQDANDNDNPPNADADETSLT